MSHGLNMLKFGKTKIASTQKVSLPFLLFLVGAEISEKYSDLSPLPNKNFLIFNDSQKLNRSGRMSEKK